jgi:transcriptional regulator with XRE-family HTH domain
MTATCPIGVRELARRRRRLRAHIGEQVRSLRIDAGISQKHLAQACGIDGAHLSRIERGLVQPSLDVLVAIGACLGADLGVRYFPGSGPRLKDRFQAPIIEALIRILHARWIRYPELAVPKARGFVDLALGDRLGTGIECEAHTEIRALDELLRRQLEKALAVEELGVVGMNVSTLLVLRSTKLTRDVVRLHESTFAAAFPGRVADALSALTSVDAPWPGPTLLWAKLEGAKATILQTPPRGIRVGR